MLVNGTRVLAYRDEIRVFGSIYPPSVISNFLAANNITYTSDLINMEIGDLFNGDTTGACNPYKVNGVDPTLAPCVLRLPYGTLHWVLFFTFGSMFISLRHTTGGGRISVPNNGCLSLAELQRTYSSSIYLGFGWRDLRPNGIDVPGQSNLTLLAESGACHLCHAMGC